MTKLALSDNIEFRYTTVIQSGEWNIKDKDKDKMLEGPNNICYTILAELSRTLVLVGMKAPD